MTDRIPTIAEASAVELLEALAARSRALQEGERKLTAVFSNGRLRRAFVELGPLKPDELHDVVS